MRKQEFKFMNNISKKFGPRKTILFTSISCIAVISIITTSAFAAISYNKEKKNEPSQVAERSVFEAAFPMGAWKVNEPTPVPLPTPTETPTPSANEEAAAIESAIKSPEAKITSSTGSVLTSSEYKYVAADDPEADKSKENSSGSSSNVITPVIVTPTSAPTPEVTPSTGTTPSAEATPSIEVTPSTEVTPSPSQPAYIEGWNEINGNTYYFLSGGLVTGWADLGGFRYYFDPNTGARKSRVGIDVSTFQENIDWNAVKRAGVDFAIIRAAFRGYGTAGNLRIDDHFVQNIEGALAAGIECGAYIYSTAINEVEGAQEANFLLDAVKGYNITLPLVIDMEERGHRVADAKLTKSQRTNIAIAALETIKLSGYKAMLYMDHDFYDNYLESYRINSYPLWIAQYTSNPDYVSNIPYRIWQYSNTGSVPGISGSVDLNIWK